MPRNRAAARRGEAAGLVRRAPVRDEGALRVSVVIPAYNEGESIAAVLERLFEAVLLPGEVLVVVDDPADTSRPVVQRLAEAEPRLRCLVNTYGRGPANAIRYGIDHATTPVTVVTMADGCDDVRQVDDLVRLVERGVAVAAASRYMAGGQQVGGPLLKGMMSGLAGRSLRLLARVGTRDATNSFKAYSTPFVRAVGIDSRDGFEIGIELTAKAGRNRIPTPRNRRYGWTAAWASRTSGSRPGSPSTCAGTGSPSARGSAWTSSPRALPVLPIERHHDD
jgi:dolichol-phosphate mannosyltransferase